MTLISRMFVFNQIISWQLRMHQHYLNEFLYSSAAIPVGGGRLGDMSPQILSGGGTNVDVPQKCACYVHLWIWLLWYNVVIAFSSKSEVYTHLKLGQIQALGVLQHSDLDSQSLPWIDATACIQFK